MKKKQLYGRGVPMLCIACQLTVAPLFFSSRVQAVPVAPTFLTTAQTQEMRTIKGIVEMSTTSHYPERPSGLREPLQA